MSNRIRIRQGSRCQYPQYFKFAVIKLFLGGEISMHQPNSAYRNRALQFWSAHGLRETVSDKLSGREMPIFQEWDIAWNCSRHWGCPRAKAGKTSNFYIITANSTECRTVAYLNIRGWVAVCRSETRADVFILNYAVAEKRIAILWRQKIEHPSWATNSPCERWKADVSVVSSVFNLREATSSGQTEAGLVRYYENGRAGSRFSLI